MRCAPHFVSAEAWLAWFEVAKSTQCRAYLCTTYDLNTADAEELINTACFQVFLHWTAVKNPLAYFWCTLKHAAGKQGQHRAYERRQLEAYARQQRARVRSADRTTWLVTDMLERVPSRQRQLLEWYVQGYGDRQVAAWLKTSPQAVRVARYGVYCALRAQLCPPAVESHHHPSSPAET